jgi:exosortase/archaeosortase family protein
VSAGALADGGHGDFQAQRGPGGSRRTLGARGEQLLLGLMMAAGSAALSAIVLKEAPAMRDFEAWLSGHIVPLLIGINAGSYVNSPVIWFAVGPGRYMGLTITPDCTVDALIVPFTAVTAWVIWHQVRFMRPLIGLALTVGLLFVMNQFRLLLIVALTVRFGYKNGFYLGHTLIGSLITVFGVVLIFIVYALIAMRRKGSRPRRGSAVNKPTATRAD